MTWARLDDQFPWSRKVRRLSDAAFRLHVTGIVASARDLTDGLVKRDDIDEYPAMRGLDKRIDELVLRGVWHANGHECEKCVQPPDGCWQVHDYLDHNPSKSDVEAERSATRERQRQSRKRRLKIPDDDADVTRDSHVTHASVTRESQSPSLPVPTQPVPSRPDPVKRVAARGTRIPDDFAVTGDMRAWAAKELPGVNTAWETSKFVDYWAGATGVKAVKLDWAGTWRNWMRRQAEEGTGRPTLAAVSGNARPVVIDQWRNR